MTERRLRNQSISLETATNRELAGPAIEQAKVSLDHDRIAASAPDQDRRGLIKELIA